MRLFIIVSSLSLLVIAALAIYACMAPKEHGSMPKNNFSKKPSPYYSTDTVTARFVKNEPGQFVSLETQQFNSAPDVSFQSPDKDAVVAWLSRLGSRSTLHCALRLAPAEAANSNAAGSAGRSVPNLEAGDFVEATIGTELIQHSGKDPVDRMPTRWSEKKLYITSLKKTSQKSFGTMPIRLVRYEHNRENNVVYSDGTILLSFDPHQLVVGHLSESILEPLVKDLDSIDFAKLGDQKRPQDLFQCKDASYYVDASSPPMKNVARTFAGIRKQLSERGHKQLVCNWVSGEPPNQAANDYTKDFPSDLGLHLAELRKIPNSYQLSVLIPDAVYQENRKFLDSLNKPSKISVWREGKQLYNGLKVEFGNCLPPIELKSL